MKSAEEEARLKEVRAEADAHKRAAEEHAAKVDMANQQGAMLAKMRDLKKKATTGAVKARRRGGKKKKVKELFTIINSWNKSRTE